jgi:hypothetical protein
VVLLCSAAGAPAGELSLGVDGALRWDCLWISADPGAVRHADVGGLVERLAAEQISVAAVSTSFHQSPLQTALLLRLAGVRRISAISAACLGCAVLVPTIHTRAAEIAAVTVVTVSLEDAVRTLLVDSPQT